MTVNEDSADGGPLGIHPYAGDFRVHMRRSDKNREWYWSLESVHNGLNVATSGETYTSQKHCREMIEVLWPGIVVLEH